MKSSYPKIVAVTLLALGLSTVPVVYAHAHDGAAHCDHKSHAVGEWMDGNPAALLERMTKKLNLTADQKTSIQAVLDKYQPQLKTLRDQMKSTRDQLHALQSQGVTDESQVRALADIEGKNVADLIVARSKMKAEMSALLTDEQKQKQQQMHDDWAAHKHGGV